MGEEEYIFFEDGKPYEIDPKETFIRLACCDCGKVHDIILEVIDEGRIRFVLESNEEETERIRREYGIDTEA